MEENFNLWSLSFEKVLSDGSLLLPTKLFPNQLSKKKLLLHSWLHHIDPANCILCKDWFDYKVSRCLSLNFYLTGGFLILEMYFLDLFSNCVLALVEVIGKIIIYFLMRACNLWIGFLQLSLISGIWENL